MKKIFTVIACVAAMSAITSCDWFVLDNQDSWDASVSGKIIDAKTGEPVQQMQGDSFAITETGWDSETPQYWTVKSNGTYVNKLVWAGDYFMKTNSGNYVADQADFKLKKGENTVDFKVTPYARLTNVQVSYANGKITATCKVESDLSEDVVNNCGEVRLCVYTDRFVSYKFNNCTKDEGAVQADVNPKSGETVTVSVDTQAAVNAYEFQYKRAHYVRVAVIGAHYAVTPIYKKDYDTNKFNWTQFFADGNSDWAAVFADPTAFSQYFPDSDEIEKYAYKNDGKSNSSNKYNYSSVYKIDTDGSVTEVTEW